MTCTKCNETTTITHICDSKPCVETQVCECPTILPIKCIGALTEDLTCTGIKKGTLFAEYIKQLEIWLCKMKDDLLKSFSLVNIGLETNAKIYKGINLLGQKEIRSITKTGNLMVITETPETINFTIDEVALGLISSGQPLKVTNFDLPNLTPSVEAVVNLRPNYTIAKNEIVFFKSGNKTFVLKKSNTSIGVGATSLINSDFILIKAGIETLLEATDFPDIYTGETLKLLRVNAAGTGVEFVVDNSIKTIDGALPNALGNIIIPDTSLTQKGVVNIDTVTDQFLGRGNKTITLSGTTSLSRGFSVNSPSANPIFQVTESPITGIRSNVSHTFRGDLVVAPFSASVPPVITLNNFDGTKISMRQIVSVAPQPLGNVFKLSDTIGAFSNGFSLDLLTSKVQFGLSLGIDSILSQKTGFEVYSDTRASMPAPIMTQAKMQAITELKVGSLVTVSDINPGLYIYKGGITGWKKLTETP